MRFPNMPAAPKTANSQTFFPFLRNPVRLYWFGMRKPELLPSPRNLRFLNGFYSLPDRAVLHLDASLPRAEVLLPLADRLRSAAAEAGVQLELATGPASHPRMAIRARVEQGAPARTEGYILRIEKRGVTIGYRDTGGLRAGVATLRQLLRQYGRRLPFLTIQDYPDFPRRGVMLDVSRGKVPNLETLLDLADQLADFKINELQLYVEHTFAYRNYEPVWRGWGALTGEEMLVLDHYCRQLGIDFVPNQNSFGHLRYWLEYSPLRKLAEVREPYEGAGGTFLRYPTTLAPENPRTLPFIRGLYDEFLPHFTSSRFNVGCDETWDLGRGQSREICEARGKHQVYVAFLKKIYKEVKARKRQMMFWGDIIMHEPGLIKDLPEDTIALNWGYEATHPFHKEAEIFAKSGRPFYVCPGTSTWMTLIGKLDNGLANLRLGADAGRKNGAIGYLNTDWGDGGHPQPLAVSWIPYAAGAALSWCAASYDEKLLLPVLSRDVFQDPTGRAAQAAMALGFAHKKFGYFQPNVTPFGAVIAAPIPKTRELMCRDGLKYYARIPAKNIRAAADEIEKQRKILASAKPATRRGEILQIELDFASSMAAESCHIMLWQQALAAGKNAEARRLAGRGIAALAEIDREFKAYWPTRNKGDTSKCSAFLQWRIWDYKEAALHFPPEAARPPRQKP